MKSYKWLVACAVLAGPVAFGQSQPMKEDKPGLLARAKVKPEAARATALKRIQGGRIVKEEIEEEGGRLVFSFDVRSENKKGIEEVQVDALTGEVVAVEHEDEDD